MNVLKSKELEAIILLYFQRDEVVMLVPSEEVVMSSVFSNAKYIVHVFQVDMRDRVLFCRE